MSVKSLEINLTANALTVLESRYLKKNAQATMAETPCGDVSSRCRERRAGRSVV